MKSIPQKTNYVLICILFNSIFFLSSFYAPAQLIPKDSLIQDSRQLLSIIENSHPDPYINGGGKIAFHRRFHSLISNIPNRGITKPEYYNLLLPFLSQIGDSHTGLLPLEQQNSEPGLPFKFKVVEDDFYIESVPSKEYKYLLGSRLISIQNIPLSELLIRQNNFRGAENKYTLKALLIFMSFKTKAGLSRLIPEWNINQPLRIEFASKKNKTSKIDFIIPYNSSEQLVQPSKIKLPDVSVQDFNYSFTNSSKETAILKIKDMSAYREGFENLKNSGYKQVVQLAESTYRKMHKDEPPKDWDELMKSIPSFTELCINLIDELKKADTKNLIIDIRQNTGGNSVMREILIYMLYGKQALLKLDNGYSIPKYSELFFQNYSSVSLEEINKEIEHELSINDYSFHKERNYYEKISSKGIGANIQFKSMPTFNNVFNQSNYDEPSLQFENIYTICDPFTYSSGFNLLTALYDNGSKIVGTPSGQSANNFGDALMYQLKHTHIKGFVSYKQILTYPYNLQKGKCFTPDYLLTKEIYTQFDYDPNAEILYSIELIMK